MDSHLDNKSLVEEYRARTLRAEVAVGNIVAGCPGNLKVMELASILGKTIVPHGSDFSATFGVGRLTEFLEGNDSFSLEGHCPKNVKVIRFTPKGRSLDLTPVQWPPKLRRDPVPPQHLIPAHHPALKPGQVSYTHAFILMACLLGMLLLLVVGHNSFVLRSIAGSSPWRS